MTPRSVKRATILQDRRHARWQRKLMNYRAKREQAKVTQQSIRDTIARQLRYLDRATEAAVPTPLDIARQRLECLGRCQPNDGSYCFLYTDTPGLYYYCDDGQGDCTTPDCTYHGPCLCLCHTPMGTS